MLAEEDWFKRLKKLKAGDACEFRYPARNEWHKAVIVEREQVDNILVQVTEDFVDLETCEITRKGKFERVSYVELLRSPGDVYAWCNTQEQRANLLALRTAERDAAVARNIDLQQKLADEVKERLPLAEYALDVLEVVAKRVTHIEDTAAISAGYGPRFQKRVIDELEVVASEVQSLRGLIHDLIDAAPEMNRDLRQRVDAFLNPPKPFSIRLTPTGEGPLEHALRVGICLECGFADGTHDSRCYTGAGKVRESPSLPKESK